MGSGGKSTGDVRADGVFGREVPGHVALQHEYATSQWGADDVDRDAGCPPGRAVRAGNLGRGQSGRKLQATWLSQTRHRVQQNRQKRSTTSIGKPESHTASLPNLSWKSKHSGPTSVGVSDDNSGATLIRAGMVHTHLFPIEFANWRGW